MDGWLEPLIRLLHYAGLICLFGWSAFRVVGLGSLEDYLRREVSPVMVLTAIAAPVLSIILMLASIAAMMGQPMSALDWPMVEVMVAGTTIGWAFVARIALLLAALIVVFTSPRWRGGLPFAAALYAAALVTLGWSGHAAATEGYLGLFHRVNNGAHLIAVGLWLGAIGWFWALIMRARRSPTGPFAPALLGVMHRFAPLGVALVAIVALTGVLNAQLIFGLENMSTVAGTPYGLLLTAKIILVLIMFGLGAHNAQSGRRYAIGGQGDPDAIQTIAALRRGLAGEMGFGFGIIALVAVLGMLSPMMT